MSKQVEAAVAAVVETLGLGSTCWSTTPASCATPSSSSTRTARSSRTMTDDGLGCRHRRQPQGRLQLHPRGGAASHRGRRRRDAQRLVGGLPQRQLRPDQLRRHQGRRHRHDQDLGARAREVRHPGQRGGAGLRPHRDPQRDAARRSSTAWSATPRWGGSATSRDIAKPMCGWPPMRRTGSPGRRSALMVGW